MKAEKIKPRMITSAPLFIFNYSSQVFTLALLIYLWLVMDKKEANQ